MSECISRFGEYSEHHWSFAARFTCSWCLYFDEDAAMDALETAEAELARYQAARAEDAARLAEDCWQACDSDCELGSAHCIADHLPRHKWRGMSHGDECYRTQRAHEAQAKADAWDAGYSHCFTFTEGVVSLDDNPYRAAALGVTAPTASEAGDERCQAPDGPCTCKETDPRPAPAEASEVEGSEGRG